MRRIIAKRARWIACVAVLCAAFSSGVYAFAPHQYGACWNGGGSLGDACASSAMELFSLEQSRCLSQYGSISSCTQASYFADGDGNGYHGNFTTNNGANDLLFGGAAYCRPDDFRLPNGVCQISNAQDPCYDKQFDFKTGTCVVSCPSGFTAAGDQCVPGGCTAGRTVTVPVESGSCYDGCELAPAIGILKIETQGGQQYTARSMTGNSGTCAAIPKRNAGANDPVVPGDDTNCIVDEKNNAVCLGKVDGNCGSVNGQIVCVPNAPAGECTFIPGGSFICTGSDAKPVPDVFKPTDATGTPLKPDVKIDNTSFGAAAGAGALVYGPSSAKGSTDGKGSSGVASGSAGLVNGKDPGPSPDYTALLDSIKNNTGDIATGKGIQPAPASGDVTGKFDQANQQAIDSIGAATGIVAPNTTGWNPLSFVPIAGTCQSLTFAIPHSASQIVFPGQWCEWVERFKQLIGWCMAVLVVWELFHLATKPVES